MILLLETFQYSSNLEKEDFLIENSIKDLNFPKILQIGKKSILNPLSAIFTKWSNTLKQFVCKLPTNCLNVFDHFVGLALKGLRFVYTLGIAMCKFAIVKERKKEEYQKTKYEQCLK